MAWGRPPPRWTFLRRRPRLAVDPSAPATTGSPCRRPCAWRARPTCGGHPPRRRPELGRDRQGRVHHRAVGHRHRPRPARPGRRRRRAPGGGPTPGLAAVGRGVRPGGGGRLADPSGRRRTVDGTGTGRPRGGGHLDPAHRGGQHAGGPLAVGPAGDPRRRRRHDDGQRGVRRARGPDRRRRHRHLARGRHAPRRSTRPPVRCSGPRRSVPPSPRRRTCPGAPSTCRRRRAPSSCCPPPAAARPPAPRSGPTRPAARSRSSPRWAATCWSPGRPTGRSPPSTPTAAGRATCPSLWSANAGSRVSGAPAVASGRIYVGTANGSVTAYGLPRPRLP